VERLEHEVMIFFDFLLLGVNGFVENNVGNEDKETMKESSEE
jgi:hypothetical protein